MNDLERAKKEFFAKNWEAGIAAAKKTNMEDPVLRYFFGYCREHGYGMERNDADAVRTTEEDEGERMETDASTPLFGDFPPSVRRENLLYYPPTSEPF